MKQKNKAVTLHEVRLLFENKFPELLAGAVDSPDEASFRQKIDAYLSDASWNAEGVRVVRRLLEYDGRVVHELSVGEDVKVETLDLLWRFLSGRMEGEEISPDFALELYHQFSRLHAAPSGVPEKEDVLRWMRRWPDGLNEQVRAIREANKERIMALLVRKIEHRPASSGRYVFPEGCGEAEKLGWVRQWWGEARFHLSMAVKSAAELNRMLGGTLSGETMRVYQQAQEKGIPVFVTPYYLSLLNPTGKGYDDAAIRSYVIYSSRLVETFGGIRAWEREDIVEEGKPNVAGWLLPGGHNIHRRYPEVAILIPDTMGRACGGLCASCQRMYDFQSRRLNFELEKLKPKENWNTRLRKLMDYFEHDTQIRDILITGGDALMSRNATLRNILDAVCKMAVRKRQANLSRPDGEKYAELQRVRLGTRLPVYLPMRVDDELLDILRDFRQKAAEAGITQLFVQTHFQSPLEVTPESREAIRRILSTGWAVTNQLVYNVAASRRGHTAKLRKVLNSLGVICYYTFTVKGFEENYEVFAPNARSLQESAEEKAWGRLAPEAEHDFLESLGGAPDKAVAVRQFCAAHDVPFLATDRSVLNLPGIGKSMSFALVGVDAKGRRILRFDHDRTRRHSPIIDRVREVYIRENKPVYRYLLQLQDMGEDMGEYETLWAYTEGETERRFPFFEYPVPDFSVTGRYTNLDVGEDEVRDLRPDR
ncbi:KamA family protein [Paraprevotella xylaniphila YIT 11841]|uniref:KamA family protein n=1 Tax=Paraprevotella xylaniphila YIT 11841 TaxID=762982 RepID=F3QRL0_9BACT|nr:KamA family protein [Paraprevotella xylaniphila]EGG55948.1 KamA family protein [Paraprevotella xylaniphila YIT 11841]